MVSTTQTWPETNPINAHVFERDRTHVIGAGATIHETNWNDGATWPRFASNRGWSWYVVKVESHDATKTMLESGLKEILLTVSSGEYGRRASERESWGWGVGVIVVDIFVIWGGWGVGGYWLLGVGYRGKLIVDVFVIDQRYG